MYSDSSDRNSIHCTKQLQWKNTPSHELLQIKLLMMNSVWGFFSGEDGEGGGGSQLLFIDLALMLNVCEILLRCAKSNHFQF